MRSTPRRTMLAMLGGLAILVSTACVAGDPRFVNEAPAGFWAGLWHGMVSVITLIIGIFIDGVEIYERNNTGFWYDLGFLFGISMMCGGGGHAAGLRRERRCPSDLEEVGQVVAAKIKAKIRVWAEAEPDDDWPAVEAKAEAKLKQQLREWAKEP